MKAVLQHGSLNVNFSAPRHRDRHHCLPQLIHFIWTGSVLPNKYFSNLETFSEKLQDYEVWLWLDVLPSRELPNVVCKQLGDLSFVTHEILSNISSPVERGDIMRYEVVYQFGGIYVDVDMICQRQFDELQSVSFVSHTLGVYNNIQNAMFGFPAGAHFLKYVLSCVIQNYGKFHAKNDGFLPNRAGPPFFTACFHQFGDDKVIMVDQDLLMGSKGDSYVYHKLDFTWQ